MLHVSWETAAVKRGGRRGRRLVVMALMPWATHALQWYGQRAAKLQSGANPTNHASIQIAG
jgi:hypothetical protein